MSCRRQCRVSVPMAAAATVRAAGSTSAVGVSTTSASRAEASVVPRTSAQATGGGPGPPHSCATPSASASHACRNCCALAPSVRRGERRREGEGKREGRWAVRYLVQLCTFGRLAVGLRMRSLPVVSRAVLACRRLCPLAPHRTCSTSLLNCSKTLRVLPSQPARDPQSACIRRVPILSSVARAHGPWDLAALEEPQRHERVDEVRCVLARPRARHPRHGRHGPPRAFTSASTSSTASTASTAQVQQMADVAALDRELLALAERLGTALSHARARARARAG